MEWVYYGMILGVFFAGIAMMMMEGLWSNLISLFNIIFSGLFAFALMGPLALFLDEQTDGEFTYVFDFLSFWAIFAIAMIVLRLLTSALSKTRVRFKMPIEQYGGPAVAVLAGFILCGITSASMHMAPLQVGFLGGALEIDPEEPSDLDIKVTRPDMLWLAFVGNSIDNFNFPERKQDYRDFLDQVSQGKKQLDSYEKVYPSTFYAKIYVITSMFRRFQFQTNVEDLKVQREGPKE